MSKFSFTKLVVGNLDAMQDFYTQVFELEETHRIKRVDLEEVVLRSTDGEPGLLALINFGDGREVLNGEVIIGFVTQDLEDVAARLKACGGQITRDQHVAAGTKIEVVMATDPEGHVIEVVRY